MRYSRSAVKMLGASCGPQASSLPLGSCLTSLSSGFWSPSSRQAVRPVTSRVVLMNFAAVRNMRRALSTSRASWFDR